METIRVNRFMLQRANRWARSDYLWDANLNKYLSNYRICVNTKESDACDVLVVPFPHYPGKDFTAYNFTAPTRVDYRGELEFADTPVILDSSSDYPYLSYEVLTLLSLPNVRNYIHGVSFRDLSVNRRRFIGNEYYAHVYRQREVYSSGPDTRNSRPEIPAEIIQKLCPLIRPPSKPFTDDVFEYIHRRIKPLKNRTVDISFSGRVSYGANETFSVPTSQRKRLRNLWETLPGDNKFFLGYDDALGKRSQGKPIKSFSYPYEYVDLLLDTKVVISPWGFSAWCIRDFEALACGCILIKPECSNLLVSPDIYNPASNLIVWCDILFEKLSDQLAYCYSHLDELQDRANAGRKVILDEYYPNDKLYRKWTAAMRDILENAVSTKSYSTASSIY